MIKSESITKISAALLKAQKEMGDATKTSKNPFFKSSYADLNSVREAVIPVLNNNEISILQTMDADAHGQYVVTTALHSSGEFISSRTQIICAKQNDPQALGSAISYARRYGLQSLPCVGAVDDDGEKAMGRAEAKTVATAASTANSTNEAAPKTSSFRKPKVTLNNSPAPTGLNGSSTTTSTDEGWQ